MGGGAGKGSHTATGRLGEAIAARYLEARGFAIVARNYRCAEGEIDLVADDGEYLVFVEVKTRSRDDGFDPSLAVNAAKQDRVRRVGAHFLAAHPQWERQPRFDVLAVVLQPMDAGKTPPARADDPEAHTVEHYVNAF